MLLSTAPLSTTPLSARKSGGGNVFGGDVLFAITLAVAATGSFDNATFGDAAFSIAPTVVATGAHGVTGDALVPAATILDRLRVKASGSAVDAGGSVSFSFSPQVAATGYTAVFGDTLVPLPLSVSASGIAAVGGGVAFGLVLKPVATGTVSAPAATPVVGNVSAPVRLSVSALGSYNRLYSGAVNVFFGLQPAGYGTVGAAQVQVVGNAVVSVEVVPAATGTVPQGVDGISVVASLPPPTAMPVAKTEWSMTRTIHGLV